MQMFHILNKFNIEGSIVNTEDYGNGHINKTYLVTTTSNVKYIFQKINTNVFKKPRAVMKNIELITKHIRNKFQDSNDSDRVTLEIVMTKDYKNCFRTKSEYWRCYKYIDGAKTYEKITIPTQFYEVGKAIGTFQKQLEDFPINLLSITIPDFHNTPVRFQKLIYTVINNNTGRGMDVYNEIKFVCDRQQEMKVIIEALQNEIIPFRVTHNDTKLNNVMLDEKTNKALCVIDLDTVMPGSVLFDFGDAIRIGASTAPEDEQDLSKVKIDLNLFQLFSKGFLEVVKNDLTSQEIKYLVLSTKVITLECGMRFLTDYLDGDNYFKIHYENHNLVRAKTQFKLVKEIEEKYDEMQLIIDDILMAV